MGLFNSLFDNKKKELGRQVQLRLQQEAEGNLRAEEQRRQAEARCHAVEHSKQQEQTRLQEEEKRKQNDDPLNNEQALNKSKATHLMHVPNTNILPTNEIVSEHLQYLAAQANWSLNTGNQQATIKFMNELFNASYGRNGYKLLQISDDATQVVGLAFTSIARHLDFNDQDLNSVAAENAFYCLARALIAKENTFCTPAIFTLLLNHADLLKEKLITAHCEIAQKDMGMPIGRILSGNPFNAPRLNDFREQAISKRVSIMAFILPFFYNEAKKGYTIPTDMPYHIPVQSDVDRFIKMKSECGGASDSLLSEGKRYFYQMFEECQDTLLKTRSM